jgi:hypothetical protein
MTLKLQSSSIAVFHASYEHFLQKDITSSQYTAPTTPALLLLMRNINRKPTDNGEGSEHITDNRYEGVSKSFRTGRPERGLQMV